jgi:hypothetical protein
MNFASSFSLRSPALRRAANALGVLAGLGAPLALGCTLQHSKQALYVDSARAEPASPSARFVTEEDSGLSIFGLFVLAEPDHYAVLLERLRRDHRCARLLYPQLDFYTDHWFLIAFPISRITSLCEPEADGSAGAPIPALPPRAAGADPTSPAQLQPDVYPPGVFPPASSSTDVYPPGVYPSAASPAAGGPGASPAAPPAPSTP